MTKVNASVVLATAVLLGSATAAFAGPSCVPTTGTVDTLCNSTTVESYIGTSGSTFPFGSYWSAPAVGLGPPVYNTPSATITFSGNTVNIAFTTGMSAGVDSSLGVTVDSADIFLKSGGGAIIPGQPGSSFYNFGISLGLDKSDGGHASAGLYTLTSPVDGGNYLTSQDLWSSRTGYAYGGEYAPSSGPNSCPMGTTSADATCPYGEASPTVLTGGTKNTDVSVNVTTSTPSGSGSLGILDVSLTALDAAGLATLEGLFSNFDIFWGTGDCSNAPIWGNVSGLTRAPEPSSIALLATAAFGFAMIRRRKRKGPIVG